ncbi:hypothetical protein ACN38_g11409 [Penicillium nordicum]|uniref:Uncharacterized protein n=1 Tax=Penicillium nordicum TaxID=229535 RepID=A0A0M9WAU9_9EURO|nr:hypothetical protein ACN38_g11409 [Penicillium nordicum]
MVSIGYINPCIIVLPINNSSSAFSPIVVFTTTGYEPGEYYDWGKAEEELLIGKTNNAGVYIPLETI